MKCFIKSNTSQASVTQQLVSGQRFDMMAWHEPGSGNWIHNQRSSLALSSDAAAGLRNRFFGQCAHLVLARCLRGNPSYFRWETGSRNHDCYVPTRSRGIADFGSLGGDRFTSRQTSRSA
jgi:hypothetical protein